MAKKSRRDFGDGNLCIEGIRRSLLVRLNYDMNGRHFGSKATQYAFPISIIFYQSQAMRLRWVNSVQSLSLVHDSPAESEQQQSNGYWAGCGSLATLVHFPPWSPGTTIYTTAWSTPSGITH